MGASVNQPPAAAAGEDYCDLKIFDEDQPFVWGLGCRDNRSLNFYILDSVTQWSLLHKLGLDSRRPADHKVPKAVIISLNDDKIFAMDQELTSQNLQNFVQAFHSAAVAEPAAADGGGGGGLRQL